jgi:hypothetical protein
MNAVINDTLSFVEHFVAGAAILAIIVFVNYAFSRDKVITRTMRHK